ncbi:MAG: Flp pilus assembly protein CpaB [Hyphomonadaceae bacterium]
MSAGPVVTLVLSILVGIAAVVFGRGWLNSEAEAARPVTTVVTETAPEVQLTDIYVANASIARGDVISIESLSLTEWPSDHIPRGAITDISDVINPDGSMPFSLGVIVPGEPVLLEKLSSQTVRDSLAHLIDPGFRAVSVEVDDASGVAGFILPDHRVDVNSFKESFNSNGERVQRGELLLSNVRVLAVDQSYAEGLDGARLARTVTLQVTSGEANKLGVAIQSGAIGLALRRVDDDTPPTQTVRRRAIPAPHRTVAPIKPEFASIRVIAGEAEETVSAPVSQSHPQAGN